MQRIRTAWRKADTLGLLLFVGGIIGFVASFILTVDKFKMLENPNYIPPCSINPIISCGSVMVKPQASVFGFANSLIGVAAFACLIGIGLAILAGAKFNRWFWLMLQAGVIGGIGFVLWLMYQSLYVLGTLCPYCVAVWVVTIPICLYVTMRNLHAGLLPQKLQFDRLLGFLRGHHLDILGVSYLLVAGMILQRFWYYWQTLV